MSNRSMGQMQRARDLTDDHQVDRRNLEMLFVRGDGVILVCPTHLNLAC